MFAGFMPTIAISRRAALDRRRLFDESVDLRRRVRYLGAVIDLPLDYDHIDEPIPDSALAAARPSPFDPRSVRVLEVARQGWTLRDILAHGVIDYHPAVAGTATDIADHMQRWFEAGACDGFSVAIDGYHDGVDAFVDLVVPILQERVLFHHDYEGPILRDRLGARAQNGLDQRLTALNPPTRSSWHAISDSIARSGGGGHRYRHQPPGWPGQRNVGESSTPDAVAIHCEG
ncbi:hypothetical protein [Nocardia fusca]|uniref:Luciferase-like monooxygenase n=1 Tax=Nocardia fusca TaxID=941183 RepID=A0ABV3FJM6_9NOCA